MSLESAITDLAEAIKANTVVTSQLLAGRANAAVAPTQAPVQAEAPQPKNATPPPAAKPKPAPAPEPEPAPEPTPEPEPVDTPDPDLDGPVEVETVTVVTDADLRAAIQPKLAAGGQAFKMKFKALREEYCIAGISELTDDNRGEFLKRIEAL